MSDYIPFEIQSEIIKILPVKSLVQFRSVSKQWKSFIDNPEFIKTYHINHPNPQHHLLVEHTSDTIGTLTSIIDDNTFPRQKFPLTAPEPLNSLRYAKTLGAVDGLVCFLDYNTSKMFVLWNPFIRKSVGIPLPNLLHPNFRITRIGFGVCRDTSDPKLVYINVSQTLIMEVHVFTLSLRVWKTVYIGALFKSDDHWSWDHVFIDGIIYWDSWGSFLISFDLKSDKFGEVSIPEILVRTYGIRVAKVHESLGLLEFYKEGGLSVCGVWMRKDGVNKPFTKIYTVKVEGKSVFYRVLGFRNNGEAVLQLDDDDDSGGCQIEVYEPSSGRNNSVGIIGKLYTFRTWSYMETLLLQDQSNSIIH